MQNTEIEFISIPTWCKRVGCSLDSGYRAARRDEIPGLFRIGRLVRINWTAFVTATTEAPADPSEPLDGSVFLLPADHVPQGRASTPAA